MSLSNTAIPHCTTMTEVRRGVDALDDQLVPLLVQRSAYMLQAARIKQDISLVRDEVRIEAIVGRVRRQTTDLGGAADVLEAIYRNMIEVCIGYEQREFERLHGSKPAHTTDAGVSV